MTYTEYRNENILKQKNAINRGYFSIDDDIDFFGIINIQKLLNFDKIYYYHAGRTLNNKYKLWVPYSSKDFKNKTKFCNLLNEDKSILTEEICEGNFKNDSTVGEKRVVFMHMLDANNHKCTKFIGVYELISQTKTLRCYKFIADKINISDLK